MLKPLIGLALVALLTMGFTLNTASAQEQPAGSIRGVLYDADFEVPLAAAKVLIVETGQEQKTSDQGNYFFNSVPPGKYTLVFSKDGYERQVKTDVVVSPGQLTDIDVHLVGDYEEMEEFVVQDVLQMGTGTEAALLKLRLESPALLDSISSDLMGRAGASDAASALRLVTGATIKDDKFAVIRGLPDRYVSAQLSGVRLPSADENTRAVELDQFSSSVIESIQVSKTFTPDQQGDASGGAVNVLLKGVPDDPFFFEFKSEYSYNSNVRNRTDFLSYDGGGVNFWGRDNGSRDLPNLIDPDAEPTDPDYGVRDFRGAAGLSERAAPTDYKWSVATGGMYEFDSGLKLGMMAGYFYKRDSSYYEDGVDDSWWAATPGELTPEYSQGTPQDGDFKTSLFDITKASMEVQWGGMFTGGMEYEGQKINLAYLYTRTTEDTATLAEDTRGKEYYFPGYNPFDPYHEGNSQDNVSAAPYIRTETLEYTERKIESTIWSGEHRLPFEVHGWDGYINFLEPVFDWTVAKSSANLYQPDKRQFGALWWPDSYDPGVPPWTPPSIDPATWYPYKPAAVYTLGNFQRIYKEITEDSDQYSLNFRLPFEQWSNEEGFFKVGFFNDKVDRKFDQDTFSNFNDAAANWQGGWYDFWSTVFPYEDHPMKDGPPYVDVDYNGEQRIKAWYYMTEVPLTSKFKLIGGVRYEDTKIGIVNIAEEDATWYPAGEPSQVALNEGDADVNFTQDDSLPSIGFEYEPWNELTFRGAYSETIARQTFKELTPIVQQEYLGGPIFIGNPDLQMADLENYDLRVDWRPYDGALVSASWFYKDLEDPIEYVNRVTTDFDFTTPVNYPKGEMRGYEFEVRQDMGHLWNLLDGLSIGGNATIINSEVTLPDEEAAGFLEPNVAAPMRKRDATGAPEYLYNTYMTYDFDFTGTQVGLFYTVTGDTLVAGAGTANEILVPNVYAKEYPTVNFSLTQRIGDYIKLKFQARNLNNPVIETEYRSDSLPSDVTKTSYTKGIDYSVSLSAEFRF